jgi:outer membrane protein
MKRISSKWLAALLLLSLLAGSASAQTKIATIDLKKVFENYWKKKQAEASLKEQGADKEREFNNLRTEYNKMNDDYQSLESSANDNTISLEERDKRKRAASDKLKQLRDQAALVEQYRNQSAAVLKETGERMTKNILKEIQNVVAGKAKAAGFSLVIDTAAEGLSGPVVLYSNNENDMTDAVLLQLNATAPGETSKPEEKKDEKKNSRK